MSSQTEADREPNAGVVCFNLWIHFLSIVYTTFVLVQTVTLNNQRGASLSWSALSLQREAVGGECQRILDALLDAFGFIPKRTLVKCLTSYSLRVQPPLSQPS